LYGISRVVIGENKTFLGGEAYLKQRGIEVVILENKKMQNLMEKFILEKPEVWYVLSLAHMMDKFIKRVIQERRYWRRGESALEGDEVIGTSFVRFCTYLPAIRCNSSK
jgi:hypothetical protein